MSLANLQCSLVLAAREPSKHKKGTLENAAPLSPKNDSEANLVTVLQAHWLPMEFQNVMGRGRFYHMPFKF